MKRTHWTYVATLIIASLQAGGRGDVEPRFGIRGTVLDVNRKPVKGAEVKLVFAGEFDSRVIDTVLTDANGRFSTTGSIESRTHDAKGWLLDFTAAGYAPSRVEDLLSGYGVYDIGNVFLFRPVKVAGHVHDSKGVPVQGASVYAGIGPYEDRQAIGASVRPVATTDRTGAYEFETLPPGLVWLGATAPGFADSVKLAETLRTGVVNNHDFAPGTEQQIQGTVIDSEGNPVENATVAIELAHTLLRTETKTDRQGRYVFRGVGESKGCTVFVRTSGYLKHLFVWDRIPDNPTIRLTKPSKSFVVKIDAAAGSSHRPEIQCVEIRNASPRDWDTCGLGEAANWRQADSRSPDVERLSGGAWRVEYLSLLASYYEVVEGNPTHNSPSHLEAASAVRVHLTDGSFHDVKLDETQNQTSQFEISVRPPVPGAIEGTLREAGSGKPVANVRVYLNHWSVTQPHLDVVSDEQGAFRFEGLAPMDVHTVVVNDSRWRGRSESLTVKPGETTRGVVIETHPAPHARGRVAITGKPPGDTLVFGIGDFDSLGWVEHAGSLGVGVCDASGNIDIVPRYPRRVGVVPKRRTTPELGGYRKFASEFPRVTVKPWPWTIDAPDSGIVALDVDLPADFERR